MNNLTYLKFINILIFGIAIGLWIMRLFICPVEIDGVLRLKENVGNIEKGYYKVIEVEKEILYKVKGN